MSEKRKKELSSVPNPRRFKLREDAFLFLGQSEVSSITIELAADITHKAFNLKTLFENEMVWMEYDITKRVVFIYFQHDHTRKYFLIRRSKVRRGSKMVYQYEFYDYGMQVMLLVKFL